MKMNIDIDYEHYDLKSINVELNPSELIVFGTALSYYASHAEEKGLRKAVTERMIKEFRTQVSVVQGKLKRAWKERQGYETQMRGGHSRDA